MVHQHGFRAKTWYYQWNTLNQLIACFNPEGECWRYTYDAFGRRLSKSKVVDNRPISPPNSPFKNKRIQRVDYLCSGYQMVQETPIYADGTPAYDPQIQWLYQPGEITPTARYQRGKLHYVVTDHQGTPREIFSEKGIVSWAGRLNTWGQMAFWQSHDDYADNDPEYTECHFRFAGQYEDKESGLYYNRFRYYDKDTGQYISPDPIGLLGGLNPYSYVHSPTKFIDPLGLAGGIGNKGEYCKPDFYVGPAGSSATMPSKAYRYMNSQSEWSAATLENKTAPLSYFGYTKYGSGKEARDAYQIFYEKGNPASWSDARLLGEFDTLQLYKNGVPQVKVPLANGGKGPELELFTSAYPQYGKGGAVQLLPVEKNLPVTFDKVTIIPE
ncbi:RHS repeat domain-containing protein [Proteus sp. NMG38-2]|uniref:RHS repeat domain-containing protein n=1 Tax=Proteus sp. NMG38-2 TaxID=2883107 RepID=UPI001D0BCDF0|nr:RHS repeat-associated core domain-containing protein [Proteus sp. NMG38-2]UDN35158.1 RHS domain-containing protein [Proteus sp. NMG38-2]